MRAVVAAVLGAALGGCSFGAPTGEAPDAGIDGAIAIDASVDGPDDVWWNPDYPVRMRIHVDNPVALPAGYQLSVDTDVDATPCASVAHAVRIVRAHTEDLPRVIEAADEMTDRIWFRLTTDLPAAAGATDYWLYCGAADPGMPLADGNAVFDLFDAFKGDDGTPVDPTKWQTRGGTPAIMATQLQIPGNTAVESKSTFGPGHILEWRMKTDAEAARWGGFETNGVYSAPWLVWIARNDQGIHPEGLPMNTVEPGLIGTNVPVMMGMTHAYAIDYQSDVSNFWLDGAMQSIAAPMTSVLSVRFEHAQGNKMFGIGQMRVRQSVHPAPTTALAEPQTYQP